VTGPGDPLPDVEVEVPPRPEYVGVVRHLMGAVARLGQPSPEFVENAKLAGSEACTNAVMLNGRAGSTDRISVKAAFDDEQLRIEVADRGESLTPSSSAAVTDPSPTPAVGFEGGLSIPLLEGLVDELAIEPRAGGGNVVRMTLVRDTEEEPGSE
jgi:serine/threonine-protein kinase RsbW